MFAHLEELAVAVPADTAVFFSEPGSGQIWQRRAQERFPAASVIKVPILLEVFRQAGAGQLSLAETHELTLQQRVGGAGVLLELEPGHRLTLRELCRLMIVVSDNIASNALLDRVGPSQVNRLMRELGMPDSQLGRRFMEAPGPDRDNWMSARDAVRCLEVLLRGDLLPSDLNLEALDILRRQQYREKIPLMLPPDLVVAHKTGELEGVRHDAALVEFPGRPYLLSLFTRQGGPSWEVDLALARLSRAVYDLVAG